MMSDNQAEGHVSGDSEPGGLNRILERGNLNEESLDSREGSGTSQQTRWDVLNLTEDDTFSASPDWTSQRAGWLRFLERIALLVERPANRFIGSAQLNPFYHTGTIATLLLIIIGVTGFYLYLFFKYGFDASYLDVLTRIETPFIARTIRAIHRYASGALIITTLMHAYRILFMERFRGPRWLAWVSGIVMTIVLWFAGVTGYWLIWDQRSQLINDSFVNFLQAMTPFAASYMVMLTNADISGTSWPLFLTVFGLHLLMFFIAAGFFWLHIKRLNRPKWLPPAYWTVGVGIVVLLVALLFPVGMLPQGNLEMLPGPVTIDPLFLLYLPVSGNPTLSWLFWTGLVVLLIVSTALPWLRSRRRNSVAESNPAPEHRPKVRIISERCTGCTLCAVDCPYGAIEMVVRSDGKRHKFIAVENPDLCVSCGICVGSCDVVAVTLGEIQPERLWQNVSSRLTRGKAAGFEQPGIIFTCERHAAQSAAPYLSGTYSTDNGQGFEIIALPCVGTLPPDMLGRTIAAGASEVKVVGCPADDCTNREGNLWTEGRLVRERLPRLQRPYVNMPIFAHWVPPDDFDLALNASDQVIVDYESSEGYENPNLTQRRILKDITWRNYIVAFVLLAVVMITQVLLTDLPFTRYSNPPAMTQAIIADIASPIDRSSYISTILGPELELSLQINDQVVFSERYDTSKLLDAESTPFYYEQELEPGRYEIILEIVDNSTDITFILVDETVDLDAGQIFRLGR